ncbi:MAG: efflux transporter outer membrane subunit [Candidatus Methylomirabilis sp.]
MRQIPAKLLHLGPAMAARLFLLVTLAGCMLGPNYQRPAQDVPRTWDAMTARESSNGGVRVSTEKLPEADWWREFQNDELSGLIELALRNNHDVRRAAFRVLEGRAITIAAGSGLYPQVNLDGAYTRTRRSETILAAPTGTAAQGFAPPGATFDQWSGLIDLHWELDLWGRIRRGKEAATAEADALEQDRRAVTLSLISDVGVAYFQLRESDEQIEIAEKNLLLRKDSLDIIRSRAKAGLASELDVQRAEVLVAETAAQIPELRRLRAVARHQQEVLVGSTPGGLDLAPKPLRSVVVQPEIPVGLPAQLLERRPDILQAEQTLVAANARIGEARAFFFPAISITGQGGIQSSDFTQWLRAGSHTYSIGPSITLPIFQGGTNVARLRAAEARHQQMLEQYKQTILNAFREVADLLVAIGTRTEQYHRQREQVRAAQTALELAQIRYQKGLVNYLDVLDSQRTVLDAETKLVQTERARLTDMIGLFKALGGGWEAAPPAG